jgi:hypothetical protein
MYKTIQPSYCWITDEIYTRTADITTSSALYDKNGNRSETWTITSVTAVETGADVVFHNSVSGDSTTVNSTNAVSTNSTLPIYLFSLGGGGGGGGGGGCRNGRYNGGGAGGAGGGYYRFIDGLIEDVPGKDGRNGASKYAGIGASAGLQGNITDFPTLASGAGTTGDDWGGAGGNTGGGASGGGGGAGGNHGSAGGAAGGGGAPGDLDAGGGAGGTGNRTAASGTNHHIIPTAVTDWYGNDTIYGRGGETNQNGNPGWVFITKIKTYDLDANSSNNKVYDYGTLTESAKETKDLRSMTDVDTIATS